MESALFTVRLVRVRKRSSSFAPSLSCSSCSLPTTANMPPELCGDPYEGWGPVSHIRQFDLTPCFEEGVILSSLLVVFIAFAVFRCHALRSFDPYPRCRKSVHILRAKLVRGSVNFLTARDPDHTFVLGLGSIRSRSMH